MVSFLHVQPICNVKTSENILFRLHIIKSLNLLSNTPKTVMIQSFILSAEGYSIYLSHFAAKPPHGADCHSC